MPSGGYVRGQPIGHRHDQGVAAGAESEGQRRRVQHDAVAALGGADERGVGQGRHDALDGHFDTHFAYPGPFAAYVDHGSAPPSDHRRRVTAVRGRPPIGNDRSMTGRLVTGGRAAARRARPRISFEDMAARRAERLVNLVICLLSTRQFLTAERIRDAVPGYEPADGDPKADEAFKRMFERDKAELRDLGVPLETGRNSVFDADDGYRITRRKYELPAIEFDPAEAAAVGLAARLWQSATLGTPARNALIKLRAGGTDVEAASGNAALPHVDASEPTLPAFLDAARHARGVRFDYLKSGSGTPERRVVEPWGVLSWRRRWYVVGYDRDRADVRSFRLSRVQGDVSRGGQAHLRTPAGRRPARLCGRPQSGRPAGGTRPRHRPGRAASSLRVERGGRRPDDHVHRLELAGPGSGQRRGKSRACLIRLTSPRRCARACVRSQVSVASTPRGAR